MTSSSSKSSSSWKTLWSSSSSCGPATNEAGLSHEELRGELKRGDPPTGDGRREFERIDDTHRLGRQHMDTKREMSERPKVSERVSHEIEQVRGTGQQRDKLIQSYELEGAQPSQVSHASKYAMSQQFTSTRTEGAYSYSAVTQTSKYEASKYETSKHETSKYETSKYETSKYPYNGVTSGHAHGHGRGADDSYVQLSGNRKHGRSDEGRPSIRDPDATPSYQTTGEPRRRYDELLKDYRAVCGELNARTERLEERENRIVGLKNEVHTLRQGYEEQSTKLASVRDELRSCQSQLDNVQRFVSTADAHADQDIIQKLQELNEEVYNVSMTMADFVAEKFTRPSVADNQVVERTLHSDDTVATIGDAMVQYLASMGADEDIALFLQIAFQAYLSHLLCHVVTSWTSDQNLNTLVEGTYQRLRKAETQAISGRWRSLTRTYIQPTTTSNPDVLVQLAMAVVSDIVVAAGLCPSQDDAASQLLSEFRKKIESMVSHAEKFGGMMSEMISGDFEIFAVKPGETFNGESMVNMTEDTKVPQGTKAVQTVLCVSRVGLRKQIGGKAIMFTKAEVVLKSFLG